MSALMAGHSLNSDMLILREETFKHITTNKHSSTCTNIHAIPLDYEQSRTTCMDMYVVMYTCMYMYMYIYIWRTIACSVLPKHSQQL